MVICNKTMLDPAKLLKHLDNYLTDEGGLLESGIKLLLAIIERAGVKLVPKCTAVCIMQATESSVLLKLCNEGGWSALWRWLQEALKTVNVAFMIEILRVYALVPVTMELITTNRCPRLINTIAKESDGELQEVAKQVVKKWKVILRAITQSSAEDDTPSLERLKKEATASSSSRDRAPASPSHQAPVERKERARSPEIALPMPLPTLPIPKIHSSTTKAASEKLKKESATLLTNRSLTSVPSSSPPLKSGKLATKLQDPLNIHKPDIQSSPPVIRSKVSALEKTKKDLPRGSSSSNSINVPTNGAEVAVLSSPPSVIKVEESRTADVSPDVKEKDMKASSSSVKRKANSELKESYGFMQFLATTSITFSKEPIKKKKKLAKEPNNPDVKNVVDSKLEHSPSSMLKPPVVEMISPPLNRSSSALPVEPPVIESGKAKKRVSWVTDDSMCSFHFFEMDESERVNVNRLSLEELNRREHILERQAIFSHKVTPPVLMVNHQQWRQAPVVLGWDEVVVERGCKSIERQVQERREAGSLKVLYLSKEMIPDTPGEPDAKILMDSYTGDENNEHNREPLVIPLQVAAELEAISNTAPTTTAAPLEVAPSEMMSPRGSEMVDEVTSGSSSILIKHPENGRSQVSLNPEIADLLKTIASNIQSASAAKVPLIPPPPPMMIRPPPIQEPFLPQGYTTGISVYQGGREEPYPMDMGPYYNEGFPPNRPPPRPPAYGPPPRMPAVRPPVGYQHSRGGNPTNYGPWGRQAPHPGMPQNHYPQHSTHQHPNPMPSYSPRGRPHPYRNRIN